MTSLLTDLGLVATEVIEMVGTIATTITSNPLLLFTTGVLFTGACIGIFGRILSRN